MPASSNFIWSSVRSRQLASHPDLPLPVLLCAIRQARRMRLRFDERQRVLKVTHPRSVRASAALAWAASQKEWVEEQLERALPAEPFVPGAIIPLDGSEVELAWSEHWPRLPRFADGRLACGGPETGFSRRIEQFLRQFALETLSRETGEAAAKAGLQVISVTIGDARTRWGSCNSTGRIRYSWRLILAEPEARQFVVAHEVAHLRHLDHGPEFKALERALFGGDTARAQALLRVAGPRLRRIGVAR
jgi:predicted metal-dependent hydrolase